MIILQLTPDQVSEMIESAVSRALVALSAQQLKPRELIDRKECLKRLKITEPTIIAYGKKGKIPEIRVGKSVRYDWALVQQALSV